MDFAEGEEALAVATIFDEGCLEGRLYARYPREIDIALELFAVVGFVIEILNTGAAQQDDPCLFGLTGVDQ